MPKLHIHAPKGVYIGQRRKQGRRRWETITEELPTRSEALQAIAGRLDGYKRGRVLFCAEWYDPMIVAEISF